MTIHEFTDVRAHHLMPKPVGRLGNETTYIETCACGATYRHGQMYPPPGIHERPYDRERAIEASLAGER